MPRASALDEEPSSSGKVTSHKGLHRIVMRPNFSRRAEGKGLEHMMDLFDIRFSYTLHMSSTTATVLTPPPG